jgi:low temperature requirement protein LtrA
LSAADRGLSPPATLKEQAENDDEALAPANDSRCGLGGSVFSGDELANRKPDLLGGGGRADRGLRGIDRRPHDRTRWNVRRRPGEEEWRASFIELFFDLVFVLVVTQLSSLLFKHLTLTGAAETLFLLLAAWWAWLYTTWATNWFDPDSGPVRAVLVLGMLASMFGAAAIPDAFGERAMLLVVGYVGIQSVRNAFMVLATDRDDPLHTPFARIFAWNLWVGAIWFAGALAGHGTRTAIWIAALACDYAGPVLGHWTPWLGRSAPRDWELEPAHFVERLMLFLIIALGETIVAAGITASGLEPTAERLTALVVAFGVAVLLWWLYFDFHAEHLLRHLKAAAEERGRLARDLGYLLLPLVAGIIVCAVASRLVIAHPEQRLRGAALLTLGIGPALYLLGSIAFKMRTFRGLWRKRAAALPFVAGATALGSVLSSLVAWALMLVILAGLALAERRVIRGLRE